MHAKLDNPAWHSLNETHSAFSLIYDNLKCYEVDYCPFGGYENENTVSEGMDEYAKLANDFFIIGEKPVFSQTLNLKKELICLQMVIDHPIDLETRDEIKKLEEVHSKELFGLVNLVQPGYFKTKTNSLGDYYGIFKNNILVATTGERMKMNDFTEVSAVVTHPEYAGKGFAKQLVAYTVNNILHENKTPYLHVAETNATAIRLYEKLGFMSRRKISFWNFETK